MLKVLKIFFLKKKRFFLENQFLDSELFYELNAGVIVFFEYMSIDRDLLFKYKFYGLCVGRKNNFLMSLCLLNGNMFKNKLSYNFFLLSPFIFNVKIFKYLKPSRSKIYNFETNIRLVNQLKMDI